MRTIPCTIEISSSNVEKYWYITVPVEAAAEATLMFAAMYLGSVEKILFSDGKERFVIQSGSAALGEQVISVDKNWLDAVWRLFVDTHLNGWSDTAHIDQDFCDQDGDLSITIEIAPPVA